MVEEHHVLEHGRGFCRLNTLNDRIRIWRLLLLSPGSHHELRWVSHPFLGSTVITWPPESSQVCYLLWLWEFLGRGIPTHYTHRATTTRAWIAVKLLVIGSVLPELHRTQTFRTCHSVASCIWSAHRAFALCCIRMTVLDVFCRSYFYCHCCLKEIEPIPFWCWKQVTVRCPSSGKFLLEVRASPCSFKNIVLRQMSKHTLANGPWRGQLNAEALVKNQSRNAFLSLC